MLTNCHPNCRVAIRIAGQVGHTKAIRSHAHPSINSSIQDDRLIGVQLECCLDVVVCVCTLAHVGSCQCAHMRAPASLHDTCCLSESMFDVRFFSRLARARILAAATEPRAKHRSTLPMSANAMSSCTAAHGCNVYLIPSLSGTDREEISVNIQIWLGSDASCARCGRPPRRNKRPVVLQRMSARDRVAWAAAMCARVRLRVCVRAKVGMVLRTHIATSLLQLLPVGAV